MYDKLSMTVACCTDYSKTCVLFYLWNRNEHLLLIVALK